MSRDHLFRVCLRYSGGGRGGIVNSIRVLRIHFGFWVDLTSGVFVNKKMN